MSTTALTPGRRFLLRSRERSRFYNSGPLAALARIVAGFGYMWLRSAKLRPTSLRKRLATPACASRGFASRGFCIWELCPNMWDVTRTHAYVRGAHRLGFSTMHGMPLILRLPPYGVGRPRTTGQSRGTNTRWPEISFDAAGRSF